MYDYGKEHARGCCPRIAALHCTQGTGYRRTPEPYRIPATCLVCGIVPSPLPLLLPPALALRCPAGPGQAGLVLQALVTQRATYAAHRLALPFT
jgi:hypothetical protein